MEFHKKIKYYSDTKFSAKIPTGFTAGIKMRL